MEPDWDKIQEKMNSFRLLADQLFTVTGGKDFGPANVKWGDFRLGDLKLNLREGKRMLRTLSGSKQGFLIHKGDRTWGWTLAARKIKGTGGLFINEWPGKPATEETAPAISVDGRRKRTTVGQQPEPKEISLVSEGATVKVGAISKGFTDVHGFEASEIPGPIALPPLMAEPEDRVDPLPAPAIVSPNPLFLTSEEVLVFQLMAEVSENLLSLEFFDGLGLEGASLDLFLAKMCKLNILAKGPEVVGQKVVVFSRLAYDQYADSFFKSQPWRRGKKSRTI
ncbi:MAG: hypothetical protein UX02_C0004G0078 [Candidatus Moranbacteria bacterium GW2011_GWC1_45_18]|nr:MAG: hypothetical protein UT79_C0003G0011 [Candidatus Moranbacteria bacterium GW2011_GWC2_40_12]KKT33976.1 MAG: hypothetical protein UW19_C0003G0011 [Candidatus Moranbacteria bacterium GW2011_GWF2_44_10]KKT71396.1 MAG: hypothetical protein UW66_C0034G0011 [Candidatus Moranbacteria bacterium GW2011_GWF1_44_4]KKT99358.1 MAG: hypothetical protein UX02_C0004G0078 [Candidatus Moranbacteria bacterium GW2011_GWC1_45_18]OGI23193.1 MAG: hypothetical protein A2194_03760 [Candidatus Moranbacteria bacte